jgi:photosynthetic reaction center M subunit
MAEYQNIFTQVQVRGPVEHGVPLEYGNWARTGEPFFNRLAGIIGNAQIGPIYLGWLGTLSLAFGFVAFEIIGLNMLASVDWNVAEFIRQLFWLALEPPKPEYGLSLPPLAEGGWWLMAGFCLTVSILL